MKIVFMGTAELARVSLEALAQAPNFTIAAVVTQPDRPRGRDLKLQPSPVKESALKLGLNILQPAKARDPLFVQSIAELEPELIVVAAYGQILPQALLDIPKFGALNVHASLLPKYRGAAPIQWSILDDEPITGVTIMKMDAGLDTGDILTQEPTPIAADDNAATLHDRLASIGASLLIQTIAGFVGGRIKPRPQPAEGSSYARKITKDDGRINWSKPARVIWNQIRAFTPWPGAYTQITAGGQSRMLKIWRAHEAAAPDAPAGTIVRANKEGLIVACGQGALQIDELQMEGGKRMPATQFLVGNTLHGQTVLG